MKGTAVAHYAEYFALRGAVAALDKFSMRRAGDIGEWIGALGYRPLGVRRAVVERQVRAAFPGLGEGEVRRIARASYESLGRTTIETALLPAYSREQVLGMFERVDGWDVVERGMAGGKGILFVSGHLGNWELGGSLVAARGVPLEAVTRRMQNPLFDRYITETRRRIGMSVIHDADAVKRVPRAMRENHAVAFLVDQGAVGLASTWVPFFGRYAKTPRGPAVFALRLDAPVVFGAALRQPSGRYVMHFEEVRVDRTGDRETDVDRIVAAYTNTLERWIRRAPEQYFWHHRRWKHQRPDTPHELGDPS
ncbi:MAG: lysophospholipid acyltransferase family protein [Gemmatimonadota bacterium]|nr:lysophospholipid acyltransferase family protein [Gemmatimonadota bacterium]